jgi:hypothetical protein
MGGPADIGITINNENLAEEASQNPKKRPGKLF